MTDDSHSDRSHDQLLLIARIDEVCDQFESAWKEGRQPLVEDYLIDWDEPDRSTLLEELRALDDELRSADSSMLKTVDSKAADASQPRIGESFGRYQIVRLLGCGAMGSVFLARDTVLDRDVALKVPKFSAADGPELIERFFREARAAATLHHRNICAVHDIGEIDGTNYISLAYIDGQSLSDVIKSDSPLPEGLIASTVRKLALALQDAHDRGVVHRDLKPGNIMIDQEGEPVVTDFGLARREAIGESHLTHSGAILGTPAYMSPEQVEGKQHSIGPVSDVYSLGVILFELLTSQRPFTGSTASVMGQIATKDPPAPATLRPEVDPRLNALCVKMIARKVGDRIGSMHEVADALSDVTGIATGRNEERTPLIGSTTSPSRIVLTAIVGVVGVLVVVALWYSLSRTGNEPAEEIRGKDIETDGVATQGVARIELVRRFPPLHRSNVKIVRFMPDGRQVMSGDWGGHIRIWNVPDGLSGLSDGQRLKGALGGYTALGGYKDLSMDGRYMLASISDQADKHRDIQLWDLKKRAIVGKLKGHEDQARHARFTPDGTRAVSVSIDRTARLWDVSTGEEIRSIAIDQGCRTLGISPDGKRAVIGLVSWLVIWDLETGGKLGEAQISTGGLPFACAFSPDGRHIAVAGIKFLHHRETNRETHFITLWNAAPLKEIRSFEAHEDRIPSVFFLPGGRQILSGSMDGTIRIWDVETGEELARSRKESHATSHAALSPDGRFVITGGGGFYMPEAGTDGDYALRLWRLPKFLNAP